MATTGAPSHCVATTRPCISFTPGMFNPGRKDFNKLRSSGHISSRQVISQGFLSRPRNFVTRATKPEANETRPVSGLAIDLRGKRAFIAGIGDDGGYGWAIAKSLAAAGAEILVGSWVPIANIFQQNLQRGKFDKSRILPDGSLMDIAKVYPFDADYDNPEDVPENIKTNKRYVGVSNWTVREVAECVKQDFGSIDILVHSIGNATEVTKPLLHTSRKGYLGAISSSCFSNLSLMQHFIPIMNPGGAALSISYVASTRMIPMYGGGMSSAKAALESDTRVLAFEAGRTKNIRVNCISAGPLETRASKVIGGVKEFINYSIANAPLQKDLAAGEVGDVAAFLLSPLASAVTGSVVFVDNGLNIMGVSVDSPTLETLRKWTV